jgi:hypothetical protein
MVCFEFTCQLNQLMFRLTLRALLPVPKTRRSEYTAKRLRLHNYLDHYKGLYKKLKQNMTRGDALKPQLSPGTYEPKFRFSGFWPSESPVPVTPKRYRF